MMTCPNNHPHQLYKFVYTMQSQIQDFPRGGPFRVKCQADAIQCGGGGGSSRIVMWSPEADAILWGGVVPQFFRGRHHTAFSVKTQSAPFYNYYILTHIL